MAHFAKNAVLTRVLLLLLVISLALAGCAKPDVPPSTTVPTTAPTIPTTEPAPTEPPTVPTEPEPTIPYIVSSAKIGVTGDILVHSAIIRACKTSSGDYDFNDIYKHIAPYYESYDYMVANLEVTLAGSSRYKYQGYPLFNCPDSMAYALKDAGVDMVLTANNHTYDTRYDGMMRTLEVLDDVGLEHIGTRASEETPNYIVKEINGIKIGMACYTYETTQNFDDGKKSLNGIPLTVEASKLVSSFRYWDLDSFYDMVASDLSGMKQDGADFTMVYIHWGDEYKLKPNSRQEDIAQGLCELGVDVIVGGHPHVLEPFEMLESTSGHQTYCLYSTGNAVSNQRRNLMDLSTGHTEDGLIFEVEYELWSDGSVKIGNVNMIPTWVDCTWNGNEHDYTIIPLRPGTEPWELYDLGRDDLESSYERTMGILGDGINACREALGLYTLPMELS